MLGLPMKKLVLVMRSDNDNNNTNDGKYFLNTESVLPLFQRDLYS